MKKSVEYEKVYSKNTMPDKHILRVKLNSTKTELQKMLKLIPTSSTIFAINDDTETGNDGRGEIIFIEEKVE